jgi:hypothetical protein
MLPSSSPTSAARTAGPRWSCSRRQKISSRRSGLTARALFLPPSRTCRRCRRRPSAAWRSPPAEQKKGHRMRRPFCLRAMMSELAVSRSQTAHLCQGRIRLTRLAQAIASPATQRHDRITFVARAQLQRGQSPPKTRMPRFAECLGLKRQLGVALECMPVDDEHVGTRNGPLTGGPFNLVRDRTCRT